MSARALCEGCNQPIVATAHGWAHVEPQPCWRSASPPPPKRPKRCGHCQEEYYGPVHDCCLVDGYLEPSDVVGGL